MLTYPQSGARCFCLAVPLLLCGCDSFDSWYADVGEIEAAGAITRGWIPDCIPSSATKIHEWHNLDSNDCFGSFSFQKEDYVKFAEAMMELSPAGPGFKIQLDRRKDWPYKFPRKPAPADLETNGFTLFTCDEIYLAVNGSAGHAFFRHE